MYNGQWLGIVQPATQSGFKTMTDPGAVAYTFERNYERPANAHPERQGWAVNWYNKFKDLQIQSGGNILSTAKSLIDISTIPNQCVGILEVWKTQIETGMLTALPLYGWR